MSTSTTLPSTLRGIFAPTLTPVRADLSPDIGRYVEQCKRLLDEGCHGLCPFGTTSEANSFSIAERKELLEALIDSGVPATVLMPGTGCCAIPDTVELTAHAVQLGCAGVLMLPPFYYKGMTDEGIFRSIAEVIERVGDSRLRVYLYHIPPVAQVGFNLDLIERFCKEYPQTVVGIKDSSGDWENLKSILTNFPGFGTFSGSERFLLETMRHGGAGSINAVANVIAGPVRKLYDNWQTDQATQLQDDVLVVTKARGEYAPVPVLKQIVARQRGDAAWLNLRPPFVQLADAEADILFAQLQGLGMDL